MINGYTMRNLLSNIDQITAAVTRRGFRDIRLFVPLDNAGENKLNFIVSAAQEELSIYDKARLKLELAQLLQLPDNELLLLIEENLNPAKSDQVLGKQVPISRQHTLEILEFFDTHFKAKLAQPEESFKLDISEVIVLIRGTKQSLSQATMEQDIQVSPRKGYTT